MTDEQTIFVVDDDAAVLHSTRFLLESEGHGVETFADGPQLLAAMPGKRPSCVLLDHVMPGMNGFEATRALTRSEATRDIPVIVCTSKNQSSDYIWALRQGARAVVVKPVQRDELLQTMAHITGGPTP